jgi:hypothetical protein
LDLGFKRLEPSASLIDARPSLHIVQTDKGLACMDSVTFSREQFLNPPSKLARDRNVVSLNPAVRLNQSHGQAVRDDESLHSIDAGGNYNQDRRDDQNGFSGHTCDGQPCEYPRDSDH